jgi:hypothetical protein
VQKEVRKDLGKDEIEKKKGKETQKERIIKEVGKIKRRIK